MEAILRKELKRWQRAFRQEVRRTCIRLLIQKGREPTKSDIQRHPDIASTYDTWRALTSVTGASSSRPSSQEKPQLMTPKKKQHYQRTIPSSPGNPFRSPQKRVKSYHQAPSFPLHSTEDAALQTSKDTNEQYESDVSEDMPCVQHTSTRSVHMPPSPMPQYTPRTKARKRLRGEEIKTPPKTQHGRSKARLLALSPGHASRVSVDDEQAKRHFFSHDTDAEVFGPSPRKTASMFRPIFHQKPTGCHSPADASNDADVEGSDTDAAGSSLFPTSGDLACASHPSQATRSGAIETAEAHRLPLRDGPNSFTVGAPGSPRVSVMPYRRFEAAHRRTPSDEFMLPGEAWENDADTAIMSTQPASQPIDAATSHPLSRMESLSLVSPMPHATRVASLQRTRSESLAQDLLSQDDVSAQPARRSHMVPRIGRAGLDVVEDTAEPWDDPALHDDDWASEASSDEYGLGDGEMDAADVE